MTTNITLELDENVLEKAKREADQRKRPLEKWLVELIEEAVAQNSDKSAVEQRILTALDRTFDLGGKPLTREEIYAERLH